MSMERGDLWHRPPNLNRCLSKEGAELGPERGVPVRFNDPQGAVQQIRRHAASLAAIVLDP
jgi:hypothetical protein